MDGPSEDFNGFGDDFEGFPKRLPEDCVEYSLFIIDSRLQSQKELLAQLEAVRKESVKLTGSLLGKYVWQRDSFKLELQSEKGPLHLHGLTNYGDSVEDEWLIVYILRQLSKQFSNLWIKVVDTDGEFLLIEAANALPRWLNPEIADNRVWIQQNKLRIIPLTSKPNTSNKATAPISRSLSLDEAYKTISSQPDILIHSPLIEEEAFYRLRNYPSQIEASLHHSVIQIPRKLAYILHEQPACIAPAAEAFYLRDPISLKTLQKESVDLTFSPADLVTVSTRFTRVIYAQLKSQQFSPPLAWKSILSQTDSSPEVPSTVSETQSQLEMGMKLSSGFEILLNDHKNRDNRQVREIQILLDELNTDPTLSLPTNAEISQWNEVTRQDSEAWLDIDFSSFEKELDGKRQIPKDTSIPGMFGPEPPPGLRAPKPASTSGFGDPKTQSDLAKMVERFESFLNDEGAGIDGAELDQMDYDDDDDDNEEEDSDEDSEDEDKEVSFDEKEFARMMREMMGLPPEENNQAEVTRARGNVEVDTRNSGKIVELDSDEEDSDEGGDEDEAKEMQKVMDQIGAELKEAGALNLDPPTDNSKITAPKLPKTKRNTADEGDSDSDTDGEVNIDFNLAKNLLESFKSQAGMAGPGSNLLGIMGMQLPRDEDDSVSTGKKT